MKKIIIASIALLFFAIVSSCSKTDTYPAPSETLMGSVIDSVTGQPIRTEQPDGIRIRMLESSWSDNPIPWYFWVKNDGTFSNTKVFAATYNITPIDGPFFPIEGKSVEVKGGVTKVDFVVVPFLNVNIVGKTTQVDTVVDLKYTISRPRAAFKITDARVFVSSTPYVSNGSFDNHLSSPVIDLTGTPDDDILATTYSATITGLSRGRTYYVRVGARSDDNVSKRYNYSAVEEVTIP